MKQLIIMFMLEFLKGLWQETKSWLVVTLLKVGIVVIFGSYIAGMLIVGFLILERLAALGR